MTTEGPGIVDPGPLVYSTVLRIMLFHLTRDW